MNDYEPPKVGDVYEISSRYSDFHVLLCVRVRQIVGDIHSYDFFVLDGEDPPVRTWSSGFTQFTMEKAMRNFGFKRIARR